MPYFRLSVLSPGFVEALADDELQQLLPQGAVPFKATVLSSGGRARSMVFFAQVLGKQRKIVFPDWCTTQFSHGLADELRVDDREQVCLYDSEDDQFHPTDVTPRRSPHIQGMFGWLGWHDLEPQFVIEGVTAVGNLVLRALERGRCRPRTTFSAELPQEA